MDKYCRAVGWKQYFSEIHYKCISLSLNEVFKNFQSVKADTINNQCNTIDWLRPLASDSLTSELIFSVTSLTTNT